MKRFVLGAAVSVILTGLLVWWAYVERGGWGVGGEWLFPVFITVLAAADYEDGQERRSDGGSSEKEADETQFLEDSTEEEDSTNEHDLSL